MHVLRLRACAAVAAVAALCGAALAETAAEIPKDSYNGDTLTPAERSGIAQEESVTPNDGRASVPDAEDYGVIPDAAIDQRTEGVQSATESPSDGASRAGKKKHAESEADAILDQSKKNYKVTRKDLESCIKEWDPQTQMTKAEWTASCRTSLEYFPEHD